jgi:hypothetical protein
MEFREVKYGELFKLIAEREQEMTAGQLQVIEREGLLLILWATVHQCDRQEHEPPT